MKINNKFIWLWLQCFLIGNSFAALDGKMVASKIYQANKGFGGEKNTMEMILIDSNGSRQERIMQGATFEDGKTTKSLSEFIKPADVKGTKLLTWSHQDRTDEQWLYLPSFRRVKRITSSGSSASFMGSEFTFEDLRAQEVEKFEHQLLSENEKVWSYQSLHKEDSGYSKMLITADKEKLSPIKIEFFDKKQQLLKVAHFSNFKKFTVKNKSYWRAGTIEMENVQTKKKSIINWTERSLGLDIPSKIFDHKTLKK